MDEIALAIKQQRQQMRLTQSELGRKVKKSESYISKIENKQRTPSLATLIKISKVLGIPLGRIFK